MALAALEIAPGVRDRRRGLARHYRNVRNMTEGLAAPLSAEDQNLPNAQLILYPDANHGSQYRYPELFVAHATLFLNA